MAPAITPIQIIIADDHEMVRAGLIAMAEKIPFVKIIGQASNGKLVTELLHNKLLPDIVLLDVEMPVMNGIETAAYITKNFLTIKVIMLTMLTDKDIIDDAINAGAKGFLFKNSPAQEFETAITKVANGEIFYSSEVAALLLQKKPHAENNAIKDLSEREIEIIRLVAEGLSSTEIGKKLFISPRTVDTHRNNILQKLDLPNIAALVSFAYRNKLIR